MYIYIYDYICIYIYTYVYVHICIYIYIYLHMCFVWLIWLFPFKGRRGLQRFCRKCAERGYCRSTWVKYKIWKINIIQYKGRPSVPSPNSFHRSEKKNSGHLGGRDDYQIGRIQYQFLIRSVLLSHVYIMSGAGTGASTQAAMMTIFRCLAVDTNLMGWSKVPLL